MENLEERINQIFAEENDEDFEHSGIKGMKWGIRRFQNKDGSLTPAGQKRYNKTVAKLEKQNAKLEAKINKQRVRDEAESKINKLLAERDAKKKALKGKSDTDDDTPTKSKQKSDDSDEESYEARKQKALKSGNAEEVLKFKGDLTSNQLNEALNRIRNEKQLQEMVDANVKTGFDKVNDIMDKVGKVKNWADTGMNAYNTIAKLHNSLSDDKWTLLDGGESARKAKEDAKKAADDAAAKKREETINKISREEVVKNLGSYSKSEIESMNKRFTFEDSVKKRVAEDAQKAKEEKEAAKKKAIEEKEEKEAAKKKAKEEKEAAKKKAKEEKEEKE